MNELRALVEDDALWNNDQYAALLPHPNGAFLVLGWYKHRGRTEVALMLEEKVEPLTLAEANDLLSPPS